MYKSVGIYGFIALIFTILACERPVRANNANTNYKEKEKIMTDTAVQLDTAILGTGCFWCTEAIFEQLKGVESATSGYTGGDVANPTYEQVCSGTTNHAEAILVKYDPKQITYDELLEVFFKVHDPTSLNRQGADVGTQYRSAIFYVNEKQKELAEYYINKLNESGAYDKPIVTEVTAASEFYNAEDYHQDYYNILGSKNGYCQMVVKPKIEKFQKVFKDKLKVQ
ncbi:peptide-methionine (S)-S-oxide reductase MsrA [Polluticaenibacter yanchengensis]|uniref:Peptide methionine sulfoxide reductase MsrA n=1 Tax=Polluticaenibacter yanchengensis TaxID=3014562 RepID=A0ABT4UIE2_9BACT|nr:peptide-methionine (S)-S-oxide reductase MsrA [Chitinophagaceae bacterium LY-5]